MPQTPVVKGEQHLPLPGQDLSETNFMLFKPVLPEIKVSTLKNAMFFLPDSKIFIDKCLPDPVPRFMERLTPNQSFTPE